MDMNETMNKLGKQVAPRALAVRTRTWTLTIAILVSLAMYIVVNVTTRQTINWIDFVLLSIMQILAHSMYFPDGDLFGQRSDAYAKNKEAYNAKADRVIDQEQTEKLRAYCDWEYEQRKERYIKYQCGLLGITLEELELLKFKSEKEIKKLTKWENDENGKIIVHQFSKTKRKILYALIFKPIPVEKNHYETIMSAVENDGTHAIRNSAIAYKRRTFAMKIFGAIVIGGIFAYIGYTFRDSFGFAQVVQLCMYLTTLFSTSVTAFTSGETCSKVHRTNFYKDLANFLDGFNEWYGTQSNIRILLKKDGE